MKKKYTFEEAMKRLEEISQQLGQEGLALEKSMALFEEGCQLAAFCQNQLEQARQTVVRLTAQQEEEQQPHES